MSVSNLQKEHSLNEVVVNRVEHLPYPTDTGDGLGLAHRLEDGKQYRIGNTIILLYPIVMSNNTIVSSWENALVYAGTGALFRNNSTTPIGLSQFTYVVITSATGTNSAFAVDGGSTLSLDWLIINAIDPGKVSNIERVYLRNGTFVNQKATFIQENISDIAYFLGVLLVEEAPIGDAMITLKGNTRSTELLNIEGVPILGDSLFNIDSATYTGRVQLTLSEAKSIYGGIPFHANFLNQTNSRVEVKNFIPVSDSQTIGSLFMERNTTITNPTIVGETGTITAFADAGGGKVTVTSAGHGLSSGEEVWIANSDNYNNKYTISNVATNTFEITETYVAETPISITVWETGWTKVSGVTYKGENERADMTADNELTFYNLEEQKVDINVSTNPSNDSIAAAKDWEFCVMKNDVQRLKGSIKFQEMTDKAREGFILSTSTAINGSKFSVYTRNLSDATTNSIMVNMSTVIKA